VRSGNGGGGCSAAGAGGGAPGPALAAGAAALALVLVCARARSRARRERAKRGRLGAIAIGLLSALAAPGAAHGYVRFKTAGGVPEALPSSCLSLQVNLDDFPGIAPEDVRAAVSAATRAWSATANPCTSLTFALTFAAGPGPPVGDDGVNVIGMRADGWCPDGTDAGTAVTVDAGPTCNAPSATAATTVFATADGRIVDGDTQLNSLTYAWAALDADGQPTDKQDLQSALTHEIGHLIGLAHPCWSGIGEHAIDDAGNEVPDCYQAPAAIADDTMYPTINPGDISRRVLSPEAVRAVCEIYPAGAPATCATATGSGCAVAPPSATPPRSGWLALLAAAGIALISAARRR
jgi:MYXO-CTERM domain-containing protein